MSLLFKNFPVFVIRVGQGYASVSTPDSPEDAPEFATLVFTAEKLAEDFIAAAELEDAEVRFLREERELARVLTAMKSPYTHMALDTVLEVDEEGLWHLQAACYPIPEVLRFHLLRARSPWEYPVYFLEMPEGGYAGFRAGIPDENAETPDRPGIVVAMFTTYRQAKDYRKGIKSASGITVFSVETPQLLREILLGAKKTTAMVAINPTMSGTGMPVTKHGMTVEDMLVKFLL